ncbi:carboxylesterase 1-like [Trifolium pratense]|uniref:carboxylesterase 1-like n=1 Tax=Trifolium pratense TaxID=57577 RepID=UPI001E6926CD|nr:carboxylesterase 1-like [Trifolium pratense]
MSLSLHIIATTALLSLHFFLLFVNSSSIDPYKTLHLILNPNGTVTRLDTIPQSPPSPDPNLPTPALSKDLTINQSKHTWARIYLPHKSPKSKLPLIVFYHGGGFIFYSAASTYFHNFCANLANQTQSVVVSLDYRLAPEHRLPAAYYDSVEVLHWIKTSKDPWLTRHVDYSRCYLMGESAGGNIAYNAGLRAASIVNEIKPVNIKGLILIQPFFGGTKRTPSELRLEKDLNLPLIVTDSMWNLSLPLGVDRDYVYSNPTVNGGGKILDKIRLFGWKVAVFGCDGDQLVDRQRELVKLLEGKSVNVVGQFYSGGRHGIFVGDASMSEKVFDLVKSFY